mmetsp:Transcript_33847/g.79116  ORF Transcript_33847/g.79116 Transcript_33847/m.79116 type:complete len:80 (+) Transcript_33847:74-313(+)
MPSQHVVLHWKLKVQMRRSPLILALSHLPSRSSISRTHIDKGLHRLHVVTAATISVYVQFVAGGPDIRLGRTLCSRDIC